MASDGIISSDDHVFETPDLWTSRVEPRFKDRAPHIVRLEDGSDWWICDGVKGQNMGAGAQAGMRFEEPENLNRRYVFEDVRQGGYIPEEHVKDMDIDGVDVSVLYPTAGLQLYKSPDSELLTDVFRAYNDWLSEFCLPFPERLKGIAMLNVDDVASGTKELERCAKLGLAGGMITVSPLDGKSYESPEYEPLWAAAQDLEMPLSLHINTNRTAPGTRPSFITNVDHDVRMSLGDIIFSGVFERHPKLLVGAIEFELSWVPHFLDRMDYTYTQRIREQDWHTYNEDMLPSDYFHRNVFIGFQEDALGIKDRHIVGVDSLLWGSDYPHIESTFPRSREVLEEILADCTEEEKAKITGGNARRIYNLP